MGEWKYREEYDREWEKVDHTVSGFQWNSKGRCLNPRCIYKKFGGDWKFQIDVKVYKGKKGYGCDIWIWILTGRKGASNGDSFYKLMNEKTAVYKSIPEAVNHAIDSLDPEFEALTKLCEKRTQKGIVASCRRAVQNLRQKMPGTQKTLF